MKVGIGITNYNRPEHLELFFKQLKENKTYFACNIFVAQNVPSVAKAKNECLKALSDCDYIFLLDDDVFPIKEKWDYHFINSGFDHLVMCNDSHNPIHKREKYTMYNDCAGCFIFLTKEVFNNIGYFNTEYGRYGLEHIGYSGRAKKYLNDKYYICLNDTDEYMQSIDLHGIKFLKNVHHSRTVSLEEATSGTEYKKTILEKELNGKLYYDYTL